jgi:murein tripeptide amidase MpaA
MKELKYDHYYPYAELTETLKALASEYPSIAKLRSIGKSVENRDLWLMEITNFETGSPESKPAVWIDGNTHAGEVMGSMVSLKTIWYLLTKYGEAPSVMELIDNFTFYVLPRIDADGGEFVITTPYYVLGADNETGGGRWYPLSEEEWRSSQHGLHLEDVDGDGFIVQMRIPDPAGEWKLSDKDARIMMKRAPEDKEGEFYRVYPEGLILNYRGEKEVKMAPARWSLNFNRNYPGEWAKEEISRGSGPYPLSEPETRAVADFIVSHPNICVAVTYHTHGGVLFSYSEDEQIPVQDRKLFKIIEVIFGDQTGYPSRSMRRRGPSGSFSTYMTVHRAIPCTTVEIWDLLGEIGMEDWVERGGFVASAARQEEQALKLMAWNERELDGAGFIDWHEFDHPQLGKVEIGGWKKKFLRRNPPVKFMEGEVDKIMFFPFRLAKLLPKLIIKETSATKFGEDLYEVLMTLENIGALPTYVMKHALDIGSTKPAVVSIKLAKGMKLVKGEECEKFHLEGYLNKDLTEVRQERLNTRDKNKVTFSWLVCAEESGEVKLKVKSQKAGQDKAILKLLK